MTESILVRGWERNISFFDLTCLLSGAGQKVRLRPLSKDQRLCLSFLLRLPKLPVTVLVAQPATRTCVVLFVKLNSALSVSEKS